MFTKTMRNYSFSPIIRLVLTWSIRTNPPFVRFVMISEGLNIIN